MLLTNNYNQQIEFSHHYLIKQMLLLTSAEINLFNKKLT